MKRPNFLIVMTDQQRWDHLGCYGNPVVKTPAIDALAAEGQRFDAFHVTTPICQPNRACLMTGQISTVNGCRQNGIPLGLDSVTYADVLRSAGWRTGMIGKSHLQNVTDIPAPARQPRGKGEIPAEWRGTRQQRSGPDYANEIRAKWAGGNDQEMPTPYYGFDHVRLCIGHGDQVEGHYSQWLHDRHPDPDSLRGPENALDAPEDRVPQCWRSALPEELHPTRYVADEACEFLDAQDADTPFLLLMSFPDPHHPFTAPGRWADLYDPAEVELPATAQRPLAAHADLPAAARHPYAMGDADPHSHWPFHLDEAALRRVIALNYGAISFVDQEIARVMAHLRARGFDEDTVVVFMSDHGDYMGDHGTILKMGLHYQSVIRVPFIWRDTADRRTAGVSARQASAIDFAPTLLQRAGLRIPLGMQGDDVFASDTPAAPVLIEDPGIAVFADADARSAITTLVDDGWRMSLLEDAPDWGELYDLTADPEEEHNLWSAPEAKDRKLAMLEALARRQISLRNLTLCPTARA
ncbi:sulfatase [Pararhodobacter oceanensis]|uniref:sulfatase family protein n=1 Tax=Pararhodobacter oceanensis TaxID=2172121 RepID=UPI003A95D69A